MLRRSSTAVPISGGFAQNVELRTSNRERQNVELRTSNRERQNAERRTANPNAERRTTNAERRLS